MAGHITAFISKPPGLNTEAARTFAERASSKPVAKTQSARNMKKGECGGVLMSWAKPFILWATIETAIEIYNRV